MRIMTRKTVTYNDIRNAMSDLINERGEDNAEFINDENNGDQ